MDLQFRYAILFLTTFNHSESLIIITSGETNANQMDSGIYILKVENALSASLDY